MLFLSCMPLYLLYILIQTILEPFFWTEVKVRKQKLALHMHFKDEAHINQMCHIKITFFIYETGNHCKTVMPHIR